MILYFLISFLAVVLSQTPFNCDIDVCLPPAINNTCCCSGFCAENSFINVEPIFPGFWTVLTHFLFDDMYETNNRMLIVRVDTLPSPFLAIINGPHLCPETIRQLKALEVSEKIPIKHIISPGDWHYLFLPEYLVAFPNATIHIPPGRIQRKDPIHSKNYTLIDMNEPLLFLLPTILTIPWQGLCQGPSDGTYALDPRNELVFLLPFHSTLLAGDTLFYEDCGKPAPVIQFNPAGSAMILDREKAQITAEEIALLPFDGFVNIHGAPGTMASKGAHLLVVNALSFLFSTS